METKTYLSIYNNRSGVYSVMLEAYKMEDDGTGTKGGYEL